MKRHSYNGNGHYNRFGGITMDDLVGRRAEEIGRYIAETKCTVRQAAKKFGISKSTVHKDITERLPDIDSFLYEQAEQVLQFNKAQRHIRGGNATKEKYEKARRLKENNTNN